MMATIETDYLVVGAGASAMAFTDALIAEDSGADVVMVDRRHRPGGHWIDAYPFVRLHQPSACYGVNSRMLGEDRIDTTGPNAGMYERATAAEMCDYYDRVLEEHLLPSGQVRFLAMHDYRGNGSGEHHLVSTLSGEATTVKVRRKLVDTTYTEGTIPSRHTPAFEVDPDVKLIPPNDLVKLGDGASGYTVLGAGKTSMDTCCWLLEQSVDPDRIRWVRPRDVWTFNRAVMQPRALLPSFMEFYASMLEAAAEATRPGEVFLALESHGMTMRLDTDVEPAVFRGATLSTYEFDLLRRIGNVVRKGRVLRLGTDRIVLEDGTIGSDPGHVYVDCTASAVRPVAERPIFEADRITAQIVTFGIVPWSAATLGYVEASRDDDRDKNRLCPPLPLTGEVSKDVRFTYLGLKAPAERMAEPDIAAWNDNSRLNPQRGLHEHLDDERVQQAFLRITTKMQPALANLEGLIEQASTPADVS